MTSAPNRRWFRFSLRTLFVVLTLLGLWLGWQANLVRQRTAMRREVEQEAQLRMARVRNEGVPVNYVDYWKVDVLQRGQPDPVSIPLLRRLLGDTQGPYLIKRSSRGKALKTMRLFPESEVWHCIALADIVPKPYREIMDTALHD